MHNPLNPQFYISLEKDLESLQNETFLSPYMVFAKVVAILRDYGITIDEESGTGQFTMFDDLEADYFFKLNFPEQIQQEQNTYLTIDFEEGENGFYTTDINIMSEEELMDYIGEDETEEI